MNKQPEVKPDVMENIPQDEETADKLPVEKKSINIIAWNPRTKLGKLVKAGEITDIDQILDKGLKIQEAEIVDVLLPDLTSELLLIGQAKGKFGGGQRRIFKQVQKKTAEGNKPQFATMAVVGNSNGYVGIGYGKGKETVPSREKAIRNAKLNIFKIRRGSGSWESTTTEPHSIPFKVKGKCGSVEITLMPAPKGKGLVAEKEVKKVLSLAGIKDIWTKTEGLTVTKTNFILALEQALRNLNKMKIRDDKIASLNIIDGKIGGTKP